MNINLIGPIYPYRGGIAHYNASLAQALMVAGHQVRVISFRRQYPAFLYPGESDRDPSTKPLSFPADYLLDPLYPWTWLQAARSIRNNCPKLLVIHWWTTFWSPAYTSVAWLLKRQVRVVFLIHNVIPHEARWWDRWLAYSALRQGQVYIVQAPHERERLLRYIPGSREVIDSPHPAYQPFSEQPLSKSDVRQQLGLPTDRAVLLFFGIVRPYKGLEYLIEAMSLIRCSVHLVVAGEFWDDIVKYQKQMETLGLSDHVTIMNRYIPNEEAHQLFMAADALIAPYVGGTQSGAAGLAIGYGLPMIVSERVAAGLPRGYPTSREVAITAHDGGYAHIVPAANAPSLAQAIDALVSHLPSLDIHPAHTAEDWARLVHIIEEIGSRR